MGSPTSLAGIIVPLITPFDMKGDITPEAIRPLIERHIELGVQGFYVGGSTGEGFLQSVEERRGYLKFVADVVGKRGVLVAQVGAMSSRDAWSLTDSAVEFGYDVVSSTPPFYFNYTEQETVDYYRELAERSDVPVLLYNIPGTTGRNISIEAQIEVLKLPNVIGSKHTDRNFFHAERLIAAVEDAQIVNGPDEMLVGGLAMGMVGGIGSTYNFMPRRYLEIYNAMSRGDLAAARQGQNIVNKVIHELLRVSPGVIPGIKLALKLSGFDVGVCRKPFQALAADTQRFASLVSGAKGL